MSDMSKFYFQTGQTYSNPDKLLEFIKQDSKWEWIPNFYVCRNFKYELFQDSFLESLNEKFGGFLSLYKLPAKCMYAWHTDGRHMWAINMVLDTFSSHTLFKVNNFKPLTYFEELTYRPLEWVIFNTQESHTVLNLDNRDRVLATYRIAANNSNPYSYQDVLSWYLTEYKKPTE